MRKLFTRFKESAAESSRPKQPTYENISSTVLTLISIFSKANIKINKILHDEILRALFCYSNQVSHLRKCSKISKDYVNNLNEGVTVAINQLRKVHVAKEEIKKLDIKRPSDIKNRLVDSVRRFKNQEIMDYQEELQIATSCLETLRAHERFTQLLDDKEEEIVAELFLQLFILTTQSSSSIQLNANLHDDAKDTALPKTEKLPIELENSNFVTEQKSLQWNELEKLDITKQSLLETCNFHKELVPGIDLGTVYTCASIYLDGQLHVLKTDDGKRITPSFVYFQATPETIIVGEHAQNRAQSNPNRGIYEVKRFLGRKFDELQLHKKLKYLPFSVVPDNNNDPVFVIDSRKNIIKNPTEISTIILQKMKEDMEAKVERTIKYAVITVPAYYSTNQRNITFTAAQNAGFTVLKLLEEPVAAALSYYSEKDCDNANRSYSLVFDLGGGTFDVAVLQRTNEEIKVICTDGDMELGGQDFDNRIMDYVMDELKIPYSNIDKMSLRRLHNKCEQAKRELSQVEETLITLNGFIKENPWIEITITREMLEEICSDLFQRTIDIMSRCLERSGLLKQDIQDVILCGGSCRIPIIQQRICDYFGRKILEKRAKFDECVAEGAAIQAAMLSKNPRQKLNFPGYLV